MNDIPSAVNIKQRITSWHAVKIHLSINLHSLIYQSIYIPYLSKYGQIKALHELVINDKNLLPPL